MAVPSIIGYPLPRASVLGSPVRVARDSTCTFGERLGVLDAGSTLFLLPETRALVEVV
jgi:hypothetical protein